jgi:hypothetical protein
LVWAANTDSEVVSVDVEVILMAGALDALYNLARQDKANEVAEQVGRHLSAYRSVRAEPHLARLRNTQLRQREKAWFLHQKWAHELYTWRNMVAHGKPTAKRQWAWNPYEHVAMGAFVFPLLVKLWLFERGVYRPTPDDEARCYAVDKLLRATRWFRDLLPHGRNLWDEILRDASRKWPMHRRRA